MIDKLLAFTLDLNRFDAQSRQDVIKLLIKAQNDLNAKMMSTKELTSFNRARIARFLKESREILDGYYASAQQELFTDLDQVSDIVARNTVKALETQLPPSLEAKFPTENVFKSMLNDKMILGAPAQEWWSRLKGDGAFRFSQAVRQGITLGETNGQIVRRVTDAMELAKRNARSLVQTSVHSVANNARQATFEANSDVIKGYRWITALDSVVCEMCIARSDKEWTTDGRPIGHNISFQVPGLHFNDRCILTAITKSFKELGFPEIKEPRRGTRASEDGQVSSKVTFERFLDKKGVKWQDETLGKGRAELWRKGVIRLDQLIDGQGKPLTVKQLKERYMK